MGVTGLWESVKDLKKPFLNVDKLLEILSTEKNSDKLGVGSQLGLAVRGAVVGLIGDD
jgi:hypothetical protein